VALSPRRKSMASLLVDGDREWTSRRRTTEGRSLEIPREEVRPNGPGACREPERVRTAPGDRRNERQDQVASRESASRSRGAVRHVRKDVPAPGTVALEVQRADRLDPRVSTRRAVAKANQPHIVSASPCIRASGA
jgi:hypothetical protein